MIKGEIRIIICPKCWRATDELVEFWGFEVCINEENCQQQAEVRGVDPGHKFLQVIFHPFVLKICESGKDRANWGKWTPA